VYLVIDIDHIYFRRPGGRDKSIIQLALLVKSQLCPVPSSKLTFHTKEGTQIVLKRKVPAHRFKDAVSTRNYITLTF